jgi:hypothetical protein
MSIGLNNADSSFFRIDSSAINLRHEIIAKDIVSH